MTLCLANHVDRHRTRIHRNPLNGCYNEMHHITSRKPRLQFRRQKIRLRPVKRDEAAHHSTSQLHPCTGYPAQRTARYRNEVGLSHLTKTTAGRCTARRTWPSQPIKQAAKIAARAPRPPTCRMIDVAVIAMETGRGRAPAVLASHHMHYAGLVIEMDYPNRRESLNPHLAPDSSVRCNLRYVRWMRHTQEHPILAATERQTGQECYFQFLWHCQEG